MNNEEIETILYKNEFKMTRSLMMEYTKKTKQYQIIHITTVVMGIICLMYSRTFFLSYFDVINAIAICVLGIFFILYGPLLLLYVVSKKNVGLMEMARKNNPDAMMGIIFFNEVIITATRNKVKYNQIKKIVLSKNLIILQGDSFGDGYIEGRQEKYLVLKKDAFTTGSENEFLEFLIKKIKIKL